MKLLPRIITSVRGMAHFLSRIASRTNRCQRSMNDIAERLFSTRTAWRIVGEVNRGVPASTCSTGGSVANRSTIATLVASTAIASLQRDCRARA